MLENNIFKYISYSSIDFFDEGAQAAIDFCGLGKLSPNMALVGFHVSFSF